LTLISGSPFAAGQYPYSLAIEPTGHFAYVANAGSGDVYAYSIDAQTGALTQIGSPITAGTRPISIVTDPRGQYVFTANTTSGDVSAFAINFDGTLKNVAGSPITVGASVTAVAVSNSGKVVVVPAVAGTFVYTVDSVGAFHLAPGSPFLAGTHPNAVSIDPTDRFAFVTNGGSANVTAYHLNNNNGHLSTAVGSPFPAGTFASGITTAPVPIHE
jgi:6-phosphogluconolactonase (cycloisomerase 2 family)